MRTIIVTLLMLFCFNCLHSQFALNFCAAVEPSGNCIFNNNKFFLSPDSTTQKIYMEIAAKKTFAGTSKATFKIYTVSKTGEEKLENSMVEYVHAVWIDAWLPYEFKGPGKYNVKIFDDKNQLMCSKPLEIFK